MPERPLIPPSYVNAPSRLVYSADLSAPHFQTYVRLRGLAWVTKGKETPALTINELAEICHHSERSMWGHLKALRDRTDLTWTQVGNRRMVLKFDPLQNSAVDPLQNFAVANGDGDVVDDPHLENQQQHHHPDHHGPSLQNVAVKSSEEVRANLEALATYGVDVSAELAQAVAGLEHVTPELVHAQGEHLQKTPGVRNLPGLLLYKLRTNTQPPRTDERRGGPRTPAMVPSAESVPPVDLPDDVRAQLDRLGLRGEGPRREVAEAWDDDPDRVEGWIHHILADDELGPGLLLSMVRSGEPAPPDGVDRRQRYLGGKYAGYIRS